MHSLQMYQSLPGAFNIPGGLWPCAISDGVGNTVVSSSLESQERSHYRSLSGDALCEYAQDDRDCVAQCDNRDGLEEWGEHGTSQPCELSEIR